MHDYIEPLKAVKHYVPCVAGSFKNTSRQSTKLVPLKGSPPIPRKHLT